MMGNMAASFDVMLSGCSPDFCKDKPSFFFKFRQRKLSLIEMNFNRSQFNSAIKGNQTHTKITRQSNSIEPVTSKKIHHFNFCLTVLTTRFLFLRPCYMILVQANHSQNWMQSIIIVQIVFIWAWLPNSVRVWLGPISLGFDWFGNRTPTK